MGVYINGMEMPQNCEECDVKAVCKNYWKLIREQHTRPSWCPLVPATDVRPVVRGKWNNIIQGIIPSGQCSNCKAWDKVTRFCPNCGADMREES